MKQLQHRSETPETLETYICNIGKENAGLVDFGRRGQSRRRAPPALLALMGALSSAEEDLRRHDTCAPTAMAGSAVRPTAMGDGQMAREQAAQVIGT